MLQLALPNAYSYAKDHWAWILIALLLALLLAACIVLIRYTIRARRRDKLEEEKWARYMAQCEDMEGLSDYCE